MPDNGDTNKGLIGILTVLLYVYVLFSLAVIFGSRLLPDNRFIKTYKVHVSPGPFFTGVRIQQSDYLLVSWKSEGIWSQPFDPMKANLNSFYGSGNPSDLWRLKLEKRFVSAAFRKFNREEGVKVSKELTTLRNYLYERYVPENADSIRMILIRKVAMGGAVSVDTVNIITVH